MTAASLYSLNWDLDSILPNPQTPAFTSSSGPVQGRPDGTGGCFRSAARDHRSWGSGGLGPFCRDALDHAGAERRPECIRRCHSAVDAENKEYQRVEVSWPRSRRCGSGSSPTSSWRSRESSQLRLRSSSAAMSACRS